MDIQIAQGLRRILRFPGVLGHHQLHGEIRLAQPSRRVDAGRQGKADTGCGQLLPGRSGLTDQ